jgi:hypothetical protein
LERQFHKLQGGGVFQYILCSGGKIKNVEDEAATKDDIEIGDDDIDEGLEPWLDDDRKKLREK